MITRIVIAVMSVCACEHHADREAEPKPSMSTDNTVVRVTWKLASEASQLRVDYQVENRSGTRIFVLDSLVTSSAAGMIVLKDRVIVRRGPDDATASFLLGFMQPPPGEAVEFQPAPIARELPSGATVSGTKVVPLPLTAWHPYIHYMQPLARASRAVLEVSWLPADPPQGVPGWQELPAADGGKVRVPDPQFIGTSLRTATGETIALP
jgi:hypothetical protein